MKYVYSLLALFMFTANLIAQTACSGTPDAGTIQAEESNVCPGDSVSLRITGLTETGLQLQWQSSTDGIDFFSLPAATDSVYTDTITQTTWFRCAVTCVASGETAYSPVITVTYNEPPAGATISASNSGSTYTFSVTGITGTFTYNWHFGDGQTSTVSNPTHTYTTGGNYDVVLYISNDCGADSITFPITVTVGISEINSANRVVVYPNPAADVFYVATGFWQQADHLKITDVSGKTYYLQNQPVDLPVFLSVQQLNLLPGIYIVQLQSGNESVFQRLVVR